jgi:protein tyrosine/serine phosphatase
MTNRTLWDPPEERHPRVAWLVIAALVGLAITAALSNSSCATSEAIRPGDRPATWAQPLSLPGVPNLHQVDAHVYRSAQPTAEGMRHLEAAGIKTVLNLRDFQTDQDEARGTVLHLVHVRLNAWDVDEPKLLAALRVLRDPAAWPVLVHCQHGADRTGLVVALYRVTSQGWTPYDAADEMTRGGFGFHSVWREIPAYLKGVNAKDLRSKLERGK